MKAIMYHYVRNTNKEFPFFRYLSTQNFIQQLDYFEKKYGFVTYNNFASFMRNNSSYENIKNKVILTFDDGFKDHYKNVFPELIKRGLFGIFYIPTGVYSRQKALDVHRIHYLIGKVGGKKLIDYIENKIKPEMINEGEYNLFKETTYTNQENDHYTQQFKKTFNYYIKYEYREVFLDAIVKKFSSDEEIFKNLYMSIDEIREMQQQGMIIGSHGVNHFVLSKLSIDEQEKEINNSFEFLENQLGKSDIKTFCYPYGGVETFNTDTKSILTNCECDFSFTTQARDIKLNDFTDDPQALPRYDCNMFPFGKSSLG